ncbi:MAG TPA: DUF3325 domain-containing protein [Nitrospirales bacterium]|nr:DUF3325 domain-containing protein [Nitrospirales bacterium]
MGLIAFLLSFGGLLALCLSMPKHYQTMVRKKPLPPDPVLLTIKIMGWLILGLSSAASITDAGWSFGPVRWVGYLAIGGFMLIFGLPYAPRLALALGLLACVAGSLTFFHLLLNP